MRKPFMLLVSDLHAGLKLPHAKVAPDATTSDRLEDVLSVFDQMARYAKKTGIDKVLIAGDLFDSRHPDAPTSIKVGRALAELADALDLGTVYVQPGNHDAHDRAGKVYSVDLFNALRVEGVETLSEVSIPFIEGPTVHVIPWLPNDPFREALERILEGLDPEVDNVLVIHQTVAGCVDNGRAVSGGLSPKLFDAFDLVISGHIHHPQKVGKVQYLGAPLHLRFSDVGSTPRGFWVLYDDLSLEMVPVDAPEFVRWEFLDDEDYPLPDNVRDNFETLFNALPAAAYLEVRIEGPKIDVDLAAERLEALFDKALRGASEGVDLRLRRVTRSYLDDGLSERVRAVATEPGELVPSDGALVEAFVDASSSTWPAGLTREDLLAAAGGVIG